MSPAELYEKIASAIVTHPESLKISGREDNEIVVFADDSDYGKLIGMSGRNFQACEDLLQAYAMERNLPFVKLSIMNENKKAYFPSRYTPFDRWSTKDDQRMADFIQAIIIAIFQVDARCDVRSPKTFKGTQILATVHCKVDARVKDALTTIAHAAGRNRGRMVELEIKDGHTKHISPHS